MGGSGAPGAVGGLGAGGALDRLALSRAGTDRAADRRADGTWLAAAWEDPRTRVLAVAGGHLRVRHFPASSRDAAALVLTGPEQAPPGARYLLGVDPAGIAYFAVAVAELPPLAPGDGEPGSTVVAGLREVGTLLGDRDVGLLVHAIALDNWHRTHTHCPRCGAATDVELAGHTRRCPVDRSEHYPRTDPAVIMTVVDRQDRLLLGSQARWPTGRFSTLAGFVEPGESLEQAVAREVQEETGVVVDGATYLGSQPWPFPSSLMLGFRASAGTTQVRPDGIEIAEARWFTRGQLHDAVRSSAVRLPPPVSIARRLIEHWYGDSLPDVPSEDGTAQLRPRSSP